MDSAQLKRMAKAGFVIVPQSKWAKDQPALTYRPRPGVHREVFPWVSEDGRRFRASQLNAYR